MRFRIRIFLKRNIILIFLVILLVIWSLGPIISTFISSIVPERSLLSKPPIISFKEFTLLNYRSLLQRDFGDNLPNAREGIAFRKGLLNSIIVCSIAALLTTFVSIVSGYAFSRYKFTGRKFILLIIIITMPIPVIVLAIPLLRIMSTVKLFDTYIGLAFLYVSFVLPLTTWISASYFQTIPRSLEEAAYIDGCSRFQAFLKILIPLAKPVIGAIAIISFINSWGQFFLPLIFAPSEATQISVVITQFVGKDIIKKSLISTAGLIATIPPILLVLIFNKLIISGITKGGVKE